MSSPYDRAAKNPGGMECTECGVIFVGEEFHSRCAVCEGHLRPEEISQYEALNLGIGGRGVVE